MAWSENPESLPSFFMLELEEWAKEGDAIPETLVKGYSHTFWFSQDCSLFYGLSGEIGKLSIDASCLVFL